MDHHGPRWTSFMATEQKLHRVRAVDNSETVSLHCICFFRTEVYVAVLCHPDLAERDAVLAHEVVIGQPCGQGPVAGRRLGILVAVRLVGTLQTHTASGQGDC